MPLGSRKKSLCKCCGQASSSSASSSYGPSSWDFVSSSFSGRCDICPTLPVQWNVTPTAGPPFGVCECNMHINPFPLFWVGTTVSQYAQWLLDTTGFNISPHICEVWRSSLRAVDWECNNTAYARAELILYQAGGDPLNTQWILAFFAWDNDIGLFPALKCHYAIVFPEDGTTCMNDKTFDDFTGSFSYPCIVDQAIVSPA